MNSYSSCYVESEGAIRDRASCCSSTSDNEVSVEVRDVIEILALRTRTPRTVKNGTLHGSSVRNSLIGVDGFGGFLAVEELLQHLLNHGNTSGTSNKYLCSRAKREFSIRIWVVTLRERESKLHEIE